MASVRRSWLASRWSASWKPATRPVNHAKVGVKFAIGLIILVLVMMNLKKPKISDSLFWAILGLTVINMAVAVLW